MYSLARSFAQFDAPTKETFVSGSQGCNWLKATLKDFLFDAARGKATYVDAAMPAEDMPGGNGPADSDDDLSDAEEGVGFTSIGDEFGSGGEQPELAAPKQGVGFGRYLRRRGTLRAAAMFVRKA